MKTTGYIIMVGGALTVVSLFLAWGTFNAGLGSPMNYNAWDMNKFFTEWEGTMNFIASFGLYFLLVFGVFSVLETLLNEFKPDYYKGKFGLWMIFNGAVIIIFSLICLVQTDSIKMFSAGVGAYLGIIGGILVTVGGYLDYNGKLEHIF